MVQGDGETVDGFADIVVLNYELLDRHTGWLGDFGFRGMVVDEAHFSKNKTSQRSQRVLALSDRNRSSDAGVDGIDQDIDRDLLRPVARSELKDATTAQSGV